MECMAAESNKNAESETKRLLADALAKADQADLDALERLDD